MERATDAVAAAKHSTKVTSGQWLIVSALSAAVFYIITVVLSHPFHADVVVPTQEIHYEIPAVIIVITPTEVPTEIPKFYPTPRDVMLPHCGITTPTPGALCHQYLPTYPPTTSTPYPTCVSAPATPKSGITCQFGFPSPVARSSVRPRRSGAF